MKEVKDLIIVGAGIAGVSAAIYAKRSGLDFLIFEPGAVGGQLNFMQSIDNYAGVGLGLRGSQMAQNLEETLKDLEIEVVREEIKQASIFKGGVSLNSESNSYKVKTVIVASGASFRKLGLAKEDKFIGKGISYCAVCDGFFFKGKDVAVVGGGNTAVEEALYLSDLAAKVTLIHRRDKLRSLDYLQKQLLTKDNIDIVYNSVVIEPKGKELLEGIIIEDTLTKKRRSIALQGLFVAIGISPASGVFKNLVSQDESGFIITDQEMKSSCDSIWACGDCRKRPLKQLITAASEGAIASLSAYKYLKGHYISA